MMQSAQTSVLRWHPGLRLQLIFAFGVLCVALVVTILVGLGGVLQLRAVTQRTITEASARSLAADQIALSTLDSRRYEKDTLLNISDPAARAAYFIKWQTAYADLQQDINQYESLISSEADRKQVEEWRRNSGSYQAAFLDVIQAIKDGRITTAAEANKALTPVKDSTSALMESTSTVVLREGGRLQQANTQAVSISNQIFTTLAGAGVLTLLIGIGWSIFFPNRLLKPIRHLRTVTHQLAEGDITARAELARADELGALAQSFNHMADRIRQQMAELDQSAVVQAQNTQLQALLDLVRELETPAIPLLDGVLLVPIVGHLDTRRVHLLQQKVVETVYTQRARTIILDLTGLTLIDTAVAKAIEQFIMSVQLLGARTILTGINAQVAQTVTQLGLQFDRVQVVGRVQEGIATLLRA